MAAAASAAALAEKNKVVISEEDVTLILQRYNPTTILTLLQEVYQVSSATIDWNALVKRTTTGITSAQEYQMLWRHLAYHHPLLEKIDDGADLLDDESDLELEIEAVPAACSEVLSEDAACVGVLISYGLPREHSLTNRTNAEASSSLNGFNDQTLRVPLDKQQQSRANRGTSVTVATLQRQSLATGTSAEGFEGNGSGSSFPPKKKRKLWTKEEDMELIAAVQKFGEGNWSNILKGDFKHNRTASQLSQRWAIIRKRDANLLQGSSNKLTSSTRSEERLATQKAISLALDMPKSGRLSAILSGGTQSIATSSSPALSAAPSDALPISSPPPNQQQASLAISPKVTTNTLNKSRTIPKKSLVPSKPSVGPNSLIQAAAFAAGGRIATPSTAASLFRAAQSKNAVHIRPGGGARSSPISNVKPLTLASTTGQQSMSAHSSRVTATTITPSQANPMSVSSTTKQGGLQVQGCHGRAVNDPLNITSTNLQVTIESTSDTLSPEISEKNDDADSSAIDVDDLLVEEIKCEDDMEFDEIMAPDHQMDLLIGDISANEDNDFDSAYDAEVTVDKQLDENENKTVNDGLLSDIDAAENKSLEVNSSEQLDENENKTANDGLPSDTEAAENKSLEVNSSEQLDENENKTANDGLLSDIDAIENKSMEVNSSEQLDENENKTANDGLLSDIDAAKNKSLEVNSSDQLDGNDNKTANDGLLSDIDAAKNNSLEVNSSEQLDENENKTANDGLLSDIDAAKNNSLEVNSSEQLDENENKTANDGLLSYIDTAKNKSLEVNSSEQLNENENKTANDGLLSDIDAAKNKSLEVNSSEQLDENENKIVNDRLPSDIDAAENKSLEVNSSEQLDENENKIVSDRLPSDIDIDAAENKSLEVNSSEEDHIPPEKRPTLLNDVSNNRNCGEHVSLETRSTSPICNDQNDNAEELNGEEIMAEKAGTSTALHLDLTQEDASLGGKLLINDDDIAINAKQGEPGELKAVEDPTQGD